MAMMVGISALIGVVLGQRFNVLILIPTIILAMVSTAIIEVMRGAEVWSMALTIVVVATVLQIVYLVVSIVGSREPCSTADLAWQQNPARGAAKSLSAQPILAIADEVIE
jgi:hypothetical protein